MSKGVSIDKFTAELKRMSNGKDLISLEESLEYSQKVLSIHSENHLPDIPEKYPVEEKDEV